MKSCLENEKFDSSIRPSDWRFSATIVGMVRFFDFNNIDYLITDDCIKYKYADVSGEEFQKKYLLFVEKYFCDYMHHKVVENILNTDDDLSEEQIKLVNEKLSANAVCKKIFEKIKYSNENREKILNIIEENRFELIRETYRSAKTLYAKFCNEKKLFSESNRICRLNGYDMDLPKKSKSLAFYWNYETFIAEDIPEFDFIPFAFSKTYDGYFINNNFKVRNLLISNNNLLHSIETDAENKSKKAKKYLFTPVKDSSTFLDYDVEVVHKEQDLDYFQTMYIRKKAIRIFKEITEGQFKVLEYPCNIAGNRPKPDFYPVFDKVIDSIINNIRIDYIIEKLIHKCAEKKALIEILININQKIYGGKNMEVKSYYAKTAAEKIRIKLLKNKSENKVKSYQQKLISAITFKDYDKFCEILLQLSSYAEIPLDFAYDLFDDFVDNKNIAYSFVEGLSGNMEKDDSRANDKVKGEN